MEDLVFEIKASVDGALGNITKVTSAIQSMVASAIQGAVAITKTFIRWGAEVASVADNIDKASQKIGISAKAYQEWDFILSQNGVNISILKDITRSLGNEIESTGKTGQSALSSLGISIHNDVGELRSMDDMLYVTLSKLASIQDIQKRNAIATELFGKKAQELAPLLNGGPQSLDGLREMSHELGLVLSDDLIKNGVRLTDLMDRFTRVTASIGAQLKAFILPILNSILDGVLAVLPYILGVMQRIIGYINMVAERVSRLIGGIFGIFNGGTSTPATNTTAENILDIGEAAKKASRQVASFDEVIQLTEAPQQGMLGDSGFSGYGDILQGQLEASAKLDELEARIRSILGTIGVVFSDIFNGISSGFSKMFNPDGYISFLNNLKDILKELGKLDADGILSDSVASIAEKIPTIIGAILGNIATLGGKIAKILTGGVLDYIQENTTYIQERLQGLITTVGEGLDYAVFLGGIARDILSVFDSEVTQEIVSNIIGTFNNAFLAVGELSMKAALDIVKALSQGFVDNAPQIKEAIQRILTIVRDLTGLGEKVVTDTFASIVATYDKYISPMFDAIGEGLSKIQGTLLECVNQYILPAVGDVVTLLNDFYDNTFKELIDNVIVLLGEMGEAFGHIFNVIIAPLIQDFIKEKAPGVGGAIRLIGEAFVWLGTWASEMVNGIVLTFTGFIGSLNGILTGDAPRIFDNLNKIIEGKLTKFCGLFRTPLNAILDMVNVVIRGLNKVKIDIPDWMSDLPGMGGAKSWGFNLKELQKIPALANGGIVSRPTLAMIGDNVGGREAVLPLTGNTEWMHTLADIISRKGSASTVNVTLESTLGVYDNYTLQKVASILAPYISPDAVY